MVNIQRVLQIKENNIFKVLLNCSKNKDALFNVKSNGFQNIWEYFMIISSFKALSTETNLKSVAQIVYPQC